MMYTITRGPSKLVTQRRTGPTQQTESKLNDLKHKQGSWSISNNPAPKLVFNRVNGKRYQTLNHIDSQEEGYTAAHEENVRFVYEAWQQVEQELNDGLRLEKGQRPVHYVERTPNPNLKNFVPIDLEEWWAQRFLANIGNS
ncbi:MAPK regulated corepressor interacting protein 2 [Latimeria chalumnae]|uniref:MAPK regulated corepressor interacting protein 2 n=1 Tax=Latimeria chalumnae TaxID=7897 RepID=M3XL32_LATCH|nr:PREDICTED: protein FAM195A [Latimeria chalumnae]|eukprot:XP_005990727.1 PREDICTED: protein FAM195A [Latimeria chalumnae]